MVVNLACIEDDETGHLDATLAKLEGRNTESQVHLSNKSLSNSQKGWQVVSAKTSNDKQYWLRRKKKEVTTLASGRNSSSFEQGRIIRRFSPYKLFDRDLPPSRLQLRDNMLSAYCYSK